MNIMQIQKWKKERKGDNVKLRDMRTLFYQTIPHVVITTLNHEESK